MRRRSSGTIVASIIAALAVLLAIANIVMLEMNRRLQADVAARNHFIQQTVQIETLNREVVNALANLAVERNDEALKTLLAQHGITLNPSATGTRGQPTSPAAQPPRR
jgi:hypothetical protein